MPFAGEPFAGAPFAGQSFAGQVFAGQMGPTATATAGTPGTWNYGGQAGAGFPPATFGLAPLLTGQPAWTTGQYIRVADGTQGYWNGVAWVAGVAP